MALTNALPGCAKMQYRRKTIHWIAIILFASLILIPVIRNLTFQDPLIDFTGGENAREWGSKLKSTTKVILLYTTYHRNSIWFGLHGDVALIEDTLHSYFTDFSCEYSDCLLTYDRKRLQRADVVLFQARALELYRWNIYSADKLKKLRKHVPKWQKWIFFSHENPQDDINIYKPYDGIFNLTASFNRKSDIFIPYSTFTRLRGKSKVALKNYAMEKTGLVVWAVSHCNLMRQEYVLELQNYVNVTVYGKCRHFYNNRKHCEHYDQSCDDEIASYKFFLAFENEFCDDYVTEKYWERIKLESVPVVMGAAYDNRGVIPGSYIDASKFDSVRSLANYLKYLDKNDTAYNEYFAWKRSYAEDEKYSLLCNICKALHTKHSEKQSTVEVSEFFNKRKTCTEPHKETVNKFQKQIQTSRDKREKGLSYLSLFYEKLQNAFLQLLLVLEVL